MSRDSVSTLGCHKLVLQSLVIDEMNYEMHKTFYSGNDLHFEVGTVSAYRDTIYILGNRRTILALEALYKKRLVNIQQV
jgi:hypothetical protein